MLGNKLVIVRVFRISFASNDEYPLPTKFGCRLNVSSILRTGSQSSCEESGHEHELGNGLRIQHRFSVFCHLYPATTTTGTPAWSAVRNSRCDCSSYAMLCNPDESLYCPPTE